MTQVNFERLVLLVRRTFRFTLQLSFERLDLLDVKVSSCAPGVLSCAAGR